MHIANASGSFLIRESTSSHGNYSLSIRDAKKVRHHRIQKLDSGDYFLTPQVTFASIPELVTYYSKPSNGLLKNPCCINGKSQLSSELDSLEIDSKCIHLNKKLGIAHFGEVWKGILNGTTEVAVRTLQPGTVSTQVFLKQAQIMMKLRHPKLVQLYAVCIKEEPIYFITQLMKHGRLSEYLRGDGKSLKLPQLIDMGIQVASAMAYLEKNNSIHQDVFTRNVLVGENLICKVANFELAHVHFIDEDIYKAPKGTPYPYKWTAPEAAMYAHFTIKSDVWSFGIVLYELITHDCIPYPGMTFIQVFTALLNGYRMPCPKDCPEQLYKIMRECWEYDATLRPTFETLRCRMEENSLENL